MIRVKPGVSLDNCDVHIFIAITEAAGLWRLYGSPDLTITGANEPGHATGPRGFHRLPDGTCRAVDLRTWSIPNPETRRVACRDLGRVLGPRFDVIFEDEQRDPTTGVILRGEHVHVQYDPDRPGTA